MGTHSNYRGLVLYLPQCVGKVSKDGAAAFFLVLAQALCLVPPGLVSLPGGGVRSLLPLLLGVSTPLSTIGTGLALCVSQVCCWGVGLFGGPGSAAFGVFLAEGWSLRLCARFSAFKDVSTSLGPGAGGWSGVFGAGGFGTPCFHAGS